ncbi:MAG: hypothetical protein RBT81_06310 [Gammaproteobacteria bacterium]|nr:hypothetical protein [Gammaproteobacteria bacterium]
MRVLDFGMFDYGAVSYDACKFWLGLEFLKQDPMLSGSVLTAMQDVFIRSYGLVRPSDPAFRLVQTRYMLNALLRSIGGARGGWWSAIYRRRLAHFCRAWLLEFAGCGARNA